MKRFAFNVFEYVVPHFTLIRVYTQISFNVSFGWTNKCDSHLLPLCFAQNTASGSVQPHRYNRLLWVLKGWWTSFEWIVSGEAQIINKSSFCSVWYNLFCLALYSLFAIGLGISPNWWNISANMPLPTDFPYSNLAWITCPTWVSWIRSLLFEVARKDSLQAI